MKTTYRVQVIGFLPPSPCAPMPVEGTIGYVEEYDGEIPDGRKMVAFYDDFKATDGGDVEIKPEDGEVEPIRLFVPLKNLKVL